MSFVVTAIDTVQAGRKIIDPRACNALPPLPLPPIGLSVNCSYAFMRLFFTSIFKLFLAPENKFFQEFIYLFGKKLFTI